MANINPLVYDDQEEQNILSTQGAQPLAPPELGQMAGFGAAVVTTATNTAKAAWAAGREQVERAVLGDKTYEALGGEEDIAKRAGYDLPKMEKIDPLTTGTAAQILAPLAVDIPASIFSLGGAAVLAGTRERAMNYQELRDQGVDRKTAQQAADLKGLETAGTFAMTRIPFSKAISSIGSTALRWGAKAGVGAATQFATDFAGSETRAAILAAHGYDKQAEQLRHWDGMRIAADAVGGVMLGLTTHAPVDDATRAASWWIKDADHLQTESAPGIPTTPEASGATADATIKAVNDINGGQPVNVGEVGELFDHHFLMYQETNIKRAETNVAAYDGMVTHWETEIGKVQKSIDAAKRDGMDDIADHLENVELPRLQANRAAMERTADQFRDDVARLRDPEGMTPFGRDMQERINEHAEESADIQAKAETFGGRVDPTTPAAMASTEPKPVDISAESKQMVNDYRNPVREAIEAAPPVEGEPAAAAPKLTAEQQQLVDMHHELRQLADATGDADLHAELDAAMNAHYAEHMEANKFNVAALCAIG